jgi:UDP-glucose:glycoprotein glucosyltransferase
MYNSETAGDENATSYFPLLDRIADGYFNEATTDHDLYEAFVKVLKDDGHMDEEALSSYNLALALRTAAPRIEAQYQYYHTTVEPSIDEEDVSCPVWVLFGNKQYCSPSLDEPYSDFKGHA